MTPTIITSEEALARVRTRNPSAVPASQLWDDLTPEPTPKKPKARKK